MNPAPAARPDPARPRRGLFALASVLVASTFAMMALGGLVTSHDAGMAVPKGFTTAGSWSLITPLADWWHAFDTRLEHAHRVLGYVVGLAAIAFLVGVCRPGARTPRRLKVLAVALLLFVIAQGVLGALRVDHNSLLLAGIHGVTGQIYLALTVITACLVGGYVARQRRTPAGPRLVRGLAYGLIAALLLQLTLGSAVRHTHSALAIPDWPLHYGQLVPPAEADALAAAVAAFPADKLPARYAVMNENGGPYRVGQVHLHFTHRVFGYAVFAFGLFVAGVTLLRYRRHLRGVAVPAGLLGVFMVAQVLLGITTVLSGENANYAPLHQTCGAALLATAVWLAVRVTVTPADTVAGVGLDAEAEAFALRTADSAPNPGPAVPA